MNPLKEKVCRTRTGNCQDKSIKDKSRRNEVTLRIHENSWNLLKRVQRHVAWNVTEVRQRREERPRPASRRSRSVAKPVHLNRLEKVS